VPLGEEIGRGGEGNVYAVRDNANVAAKVYHKRPLPPDRAAKLQQMVSSGSPALATVAAWPTSILFDARSREACGLIMPRISGAWQLHELYSTINRRRHFPEAQWHHLVLAARNTAAAFDSIHDHDTIVGDVNQGNLLVDGQMCVRFIDCDSFQIKGKDGTFTCPVGTPHFTPPELQSERFDEIVRTTHHDCFGLAVLIFHLLFVGRHPFAGRFRGDRDLAIEQAIAERRYAFSVNTEATLMEPPPASLTRTDVPTPLAELFEQAFRGNGAERPQAWKWVEVLEDLIKQRKSCRFDAAHVYYRELEICPWCRIEGMGGPSLFLTFNLASAISTERLGELESRISQFQAIQFPDVPRGRLVAPQAPVRRKTTTRPKLSAPDIATGALLACVPLAGAGFAFPPLFLAAAVGVLLSAGYLLLGRPCRERRDKVIALRQRLENLNRRLQANAHRVVSDHQEREAVFDQAATQFERQVAAYRAEGRQLGDVLRDFEKEEYRQQRSDFLSAHLIRDNTRKIRGISHGVVSMLESYGIESALEVEKHMLYGIPNVGTAMAMELLHWRGDLESQFTYKPSIGAATSDIQLDEPTVRQGVKMFQAQKILNLGKRLNLLSQSGGGELIQALAAFDDSVVQWKRSHVHLDEFQIGRRRLERQVNRSTLALVGMTIGVPLALVGLYFALM
jgi:DNA-binding helix-hairpin-helix protein with protein kinase domain